MRILRELSKGNKLTSKDICSRELIPQQFAYKILKKLQRAGLVQIKRGVEGGCKLAAELKNISLYDLIEIMEAGNTISSCMNPDFKCAWRQKNGSKCVAHNNLLKVQRAFDEELKSYSLHDVLFKDEGKD